MEFMRSVITLTDCLREKGINWELMIEPATVLHVMRSVMASRVLSEPAFTHLLFIDTDMGFSPSAVMRMLAADSEVIGCAYPYRTLPLHEPVSTSGVPLRQIMSEMAPYTAYFARGTAKVDVNNGICEVEALGTGLMLVRRDVLEALVRTGAISRYRNHFPYDQYLKQQHYHGFFDYVIEDGACLGEDISFCRRWRQTGGKILAICDQEIMHIGPLPVLGRYLDRLKAGRI